MCPLWHHYGQLSRRILTLKRSKQKELKGGLYFHWNVNNIECCGLNKEDCALCGWPLWPLPAGYEGVPEFFSDLLNHITAMLQSHSPDFPPAVPMAAVPTAPPCCCGGGVLAKEAGGNPWIMEGDGALKGPRQRLGCNAAMSPNFQQHCVSTIATKASSQWLLPSLIPQNPFVWTKKKHGWL